jgi:hypothetical protein
MSQRIESKQSYSILKGGVFNSLNEIKQTIENPLKITEHEVSNLKKYYSYLKHRNHSDKYLRVIVKYLNGDGFVLTAHFMRNIK